MSLIVDKRKSGKNKSVGNRQKFIKRYKHKIKGNIDKIAGDKGITDVLKDRKVVIDQNDIEEPDFNFDLATGERDLIFPGNKNMQKGDKIRRPPQNDDEEGTGGSNSRENGFDEFTFTLTKKEFLDIYFGDMELPDFIKESLKGCNKYRWKRTGYSKDGIPPRLDLVKTLKQGLARRIANKKSTLLCPVCWKDDLNEIDKTVDISFKYQCKECGTRSDGIPGDKKQRYLDDIDLRYKHFSKQPFPVKQATMICLMDISGSMGEYEKNIAKKFFLLLYLFLHKVYKTVNVIFVSHTTDAKEVTEEEFFYSTEMGGTIVSSGLRLVNEIIDKRIQLGTTNVYISQASDGDNFMEDDVVSASLVEELLQKVQYFAYIQTESKNRKEWKESRNVNDLIKLYEEIAERHKNLQARHVSSETDVYPVLRELFEAK
jgi:uncharacterized sporulation protein YeaH/YhbH (DUF444 family)